MDLRTFRRSGPGLAECESEAAWRRLWGDRRAHRSLDTRGPVSNVAQEKQAQEAKLHKIDRGDIPPLRIAALYAAGKA